MDIDQVVELNSSSPERLETSKPHTEDEHSDDQQDRRRKKERMFKPAFPLARIKALMKLDINDSTTVHPTIAQDAVYAVAVATEMFLEVLSKEAFDYTKRDGRKAVTYRDVSSAVNDVHELEFLTEIVPNTVSFHEAMNRRKALHELQQTDQQSSPMAT